MDTFSEQYKHQSQLQISCCHLQKSKDGIKLALYTLTINKANNVKLVKYFIDQHSLSLLVYQRSLIQAGQMGMHISQYQVVTSSNTAHEITNTLRNISNGSSRIIMVSSTGVQQAQIMIQAYELGLMNKDFVWLLMNDASGFKLQDAIDGYNKNHTTPIDFAAAYNGVFQFGDWLSLNGYDPFESFLDRWAALNPNA